MKNIIFIIFLSFCFITPAYSYDKELANSYEQFFSDFKGKATPKALQMMPAKTLVEALKTNKKLFLIDVRTPGESGIYGLTVKHSLTVPMNEVFNPDVLKQIPKQGKVVILCKGGHRATAIAIGLRHIGLKNIYILKGGYGSLVKYLSHKTAY